MTTTIRCADGHQFDLEDHDSKILIAGYRRCPRTGCLRNGFVVKETEGDMQPLDLRLEICDTCGQPVTILTTKRQEGRL